MNTRLRLTILVAVLSFLTPATSILHAQVRTATEGMNVPDGTRKCIIPRDRPLKQTDLLLVPLTCLEPVVNVSATTGNQAESFINVNPTNPNNLVATSNNPSSASIFRAYSTDAGATWTRGTIATGVACCDGQAAWDTFGNLFLVYINNSVNQINVILSTDGGATFSAPVTAGTGSVDQPSIAVGNGSVWVDWNSSGSMVARGAPVTGLGAWGPFNALQTIPSASGSFGGIAVGPGPNGGKVIVTYQSPTGGQGPATIYANVDADGLGAGGFGSRITVSSTNVGGFDFIPAQNGRSIDAEAGLVWDATGGPFNNRIYLVYTDETVNENNDTDIEMRTSTDDGATWTAPVRVNDDATTNSQFLPYVALDPKEYSNSVTAVYVPAGHSADELRKVILERFNMPLGTGLGKLQDKVFRIGHLGDFNDLMLAGTLGGVEMGLDLAGVPHRKGGVAAALDYLTESLKDAATLARV